MVTCKINEIHYLIKCDRPALEGDPEGLCILHSRQADKDKEGRFTDAVKEKLAQEDYDFRRVFFPADIMIFSGREFKKHAYFSRATFSGKAYFYVATFSGVADFSEATFSREANFSEANFSGVTFFRQTDFQGPASFSRIIIKNQLWLDTINTARKGKAGKTFKADFSYLRFAEAGRLHFQDLSLAHATFTGADLNLCRFHNVDWHPFRGRQALHDEMLLYKEENPSKEEYARVEESYRYLKLNYEGAGDFKRAGDFHYGEMEMHRRASKWRRFPFYWNNLYRFFSGYGERPLRAFICLLALIPVFAALVWGLGINHAGCQPLVTYGDALLFIFEKATLQRPPWPTDVKNINWVGKILSSLSVLLLPGQAALFILALRNRLGRRR